MTLKEVSVGKEYVIKEINTQDSELESFLFSLGCYKDAGVTVVSRGKDSVIVLLKNGKYNIDNQLAEAILV